MPPITPSILLGSQIQLKPLHESHRAELYTAAQDEPIWTYNGSNWPQVKSILQQRLLQFS